LWGVTGGRVEAVERVRTVAGEGFEWVEPVEPFDLWEARMAEDAERSWSVSMVSDHLAGLLTR